MVTILAHEIVETTSDFNSAWSFDPGAKNAAGVSMAKEESADACVWTFGNNRLENSNVLWGSKRFLIQQNWVPGYGCSMTLV